VVEGMLCGCWRRGWAPAARLRLQQRAGHVAERGEGGSVLLLLRCGARGHQLQEALLDLFALRLTVVLVAWA
jgi:hypothetical protein